MLRHVFRQQQHFVCLGITFGVIQIGEGSTCRIMISSTLGNDSMDFSQLVWRLSLENLVLLWITSFARSPPAATFDITSLEAESWPNHWIAMLGETLPSRVVACDNPWNSGHVRNSGPTRPIMSRGYCRLTSTKQNINRITRSESLNPGTMGCSRINPKSNRCMGANVTSNDSQWD
jgi:hypothetical protein